MLGFVQKMIVIMTISLISHSLLAMTQDEARHLLSRTGFGGDYSEIEQLSKFSYPDAVDQLLNQINSQVEIAPPAWLSEPISFDRRHMKNASQEERMIMRQELRKKGLEVKGWWYAEMVNTDSPLTEKMTLFWHNHFTSSMQKVKFPVLLYRQNQLFRQHALGNFKQLTHAITKDPAMLGYLDNFKSTKQSPNENFARELLELFTLGEGHYSEQDIKEAARAFTGWSIDRKTGEFRFYKRRHDYGEKIFMGQPGKLDGDDVVEIIFQRPEAATFLVNKLWLEFISETPNQKEVNRLANFFRNNNYEMKPLMRELLLSHHFRDPDNYGRLIKSPVEYLVGTLRIFDIPVQDGRLVAFASAGLGQNLFDPPNVKGWSGGRDWITSSSLLSRQQLIERMFRGGAEAENLPPERKFKLPKMMRDIRQKVDLRPYLENFIARHNQQEIVSTLLVSEPIDSDISSKHNLNMNDVLALMSDPIYQLK